MLIFFDQWIVMLHLSLGMSSLRDVYKPEAPIWHGRVLLKCLQSFNGYVLLQGATTFDITENSWVYFKSCVDDTWLYIVLEYVNKILKCKRSLCIDAIRCKFSITFFINQEKCDTRRVQEEFNGKTLRNSWWVGKYGNCPLRQSENNINLQLSFFCLFVSLNSEADLRWPPQMRRLILKGQQKTWKVFVQRRRIRGPLQSWEEE